MGARPDDTTTGRWGASPADWDSLAHWYDLAEDLLPVVSNPTATISSTSKLQALGKVPSRYNGDGHVVGFAKWTEKRATAAEIDHWSKHPDYGICIQTRRLRAIDVDVDDRETVERIMAVLRESLGVERGTAVPVRYRDNSAKILVPVWCPEGGLTKRRLILPDGKGAVELLATGQQFVAVGTHPSGARYQWSDGPRDGPADAPSLAFAPLEPEELEALWLRLRDLLGAEDSRSKATVDRAVAIGEAAARDPVAVHLYEHGLVLDIGRDGQLYTPCPNAAEHTTSSGPSETAYYPAHTGGYQQGHWVCLHAHCAGKPDSFFTNLLLPIEFEDLTLEAEAAVAPGGEVGVGPVDAARAARFAPVALGAFLAGADHEAWLVKHVLPARGIVTVFGESGAGKSFTVIDLACHIALARPWQGRRVTGGRVVYIAAEGAGGIRRRLQAWCTAHDVDPDAVDLHMIAARPNFLERADVAAVAAAIGRAAMVVVDTAMAVTPGGDENSSEDMGRLMRFAALVADAVGGLVLLVHHAGKDVSRGQRGWSGLKGAVDTELEVSREDEDRCLRLSKVRDGPLEGFRWHFRLEERVLGYDADGDALTSAVVTWVEPPAKASRGRKLSDLQQLVLQTAADLLQQGEALPKDDLVVAVVRRIPSPPPGKRDTRAQVVQASLVRLARTGEIEFIDDTVKLP